MAQLNPTFCLAHPDLQNIPFVGQTSQEIRLTEKFAEWNEKVRVRGGNRPWKLWFHNVKLYNLHKIGIGMEIGKNRENYQQNRG